MWPSCGHPMPLMSRIAPMSVEPPLQRLYQLLGMAQGIKILKAQRFGPQEVKVGRRRQWSIKSIHDRRKLNHIESLEVVVVCPFHCQWPDDMKLYMFVEFLDFCFWRTTSVTKLRPACGAPHALAKGVQLRDETRSDLYSLLPIRAWRFWKLWKGKKQCENIWKRRILFPRSLWWLSLSLCACYYKKYWEVLQSHAIKSLQLVTGGHEAQSASLKMALWMWPHLSLSFHVLDDFLTFWSAEIMTAV